MVPVQLHESMVDFEKGSGLTLKNVFDVEALQTTDIPMLLEYIAVVLQTSLDYPEDIADRDIRKLQEGFHGYLTSLLERLDDFTEDRVMPYAEECRWTLLRFLARRANLLSEAMALEFFLTFDMRPTRVVPRVSCLG